MSEPIKRYDSWGFESEYGIYMRAADVDAALKKNAGDAATLRGFIKTYGCTPSMMASDRDTLQARLAEVEERHAETRGLVRDLTTCLKNRNRTIATLEARLAELTDWRATVTVALQREGGAFFADVPKHIRDLITEGDALEARVKECQRDLAHWKDCHGVTADKLVDAETALAQCRTALEAIALRAGPHSSVMARDVRTLAKAALASLEARGIDGAKGELS